MKKILIFVLICSSLTVFAQEEMDVPAEIDSETMIDPETNYESEMFAQKQDDVSYTSSPLIDNSDEFEAEEEVYDSESDY